MPTLPTFTVTDAQAQRLIAAFGPVDTTKTAQENYKVWLKQQLVQFVLDFETKAEAQTFQANVKSKRDSLEGSLTD